MQGHILIVDDERDLTQALGYHLEREGYAVSIVHCGREAVAMAHKPDLVLLDLMLPDIPGTEVCRQLKAQEETADIPVIFISARGDEIDRVVGFELGAEDYVVKPFSTRELILRIRAILRHTRPQTPVEEVHGPLRIDHTGYRAWVEGTEVPLSALEIKLLMTLVERPGWVHSRERLLEAVWGGEGQVSVRAVDSHVKRLRRKLGPASDYLQAIRGVGYRFRADRADQ